MQPTGYIDGSIGPIDQIRAPVLDRGFLYGESAYVVKRGVHSEELATATECFVTSATCEVMPVCALKIETSKALRFADSGGEKTRIDVWHWIDVRY